MIERVNCRAVGAGRVGGAGPSAGFWAPVVKKTGTPAIARAAAVNNKRSQGVPRMAHLFPTGEQSGNASSRDPRGFRRPKANNGNCRGKPHVPRICSGDRQTASLLH